MVTTSCSLRTHHRHNDAHGTQNMSLQAEPNGYMLSRIAVYALAEDGSASLPKT